MPKRQKTIKKENMYFTQETEDAIVAYNNETCDRNRNRIYLEKIYQPLCKLAENVYNTYKFSYFEVPPEDVQSEVVSFMTSNLHKYKSKSDGGSKAYSYFTIVAKHWLIHSNNNTYNKWKRHTEILEQPEEDIDGEILMFEEIDSEESKELVKLTIDYWERNIPNVFIKKKEMEIAFAILELFRISDRIENFNKKAIYLYIREISGCKTQHITKVINKMKLYQKDIFNDYFEKGYVSLSPKNIEKSEFLEIDQ
jgi:hypothetical protein